MLTGAARVSVKEPTVSWGTGEGGGGREAEGLTEVVLASDPVLLEDMERPDVPVLAFTSPVPGLVRATLNATRRAGFHHCDGVDRTSCGRLIGQGGIQSPDPTRYLAQSCSMMSCHLSDQASAVSHDVGGRQTKTGSC
jgi:hypothetical protein